MVQNISNVPPTGDNFGSSNAGNIQTPAMAGYIDDLLALAGQGSIFQGVLGNGSANDPETQMVLRAMMAIIGSPGFKAALQQEEAAQNSLPSNQQCQAFKALYNLLTCDQIPVPSNLSSQFPNGLTILGLSEQYVSDGGESGTSTANADDQEYMQSALGQDGALDILIGMLDPGSRFPTSETFSFNMTGAYDSSPLSSGGKDKSDLNALMGSLQGFCNGFSNNPENALIDLDSIISLYNSSTSAQNDPNFQLAWALLNDPGFNPGGTLKNASGQPMEDSKGNTIEAYSLAQIAADYANGTIQPTDAVALFTDLQGLLSQSVGNSTNTTWQGLFEQLSNLFN